MTDCHLVLGRLDPENFLGSRMQLDVEAAERAIQTRIAEPIGATLEQAADGILSIAETNMTYAIRAITVERGLDPREFALFSYGGGGGLFAAATAEELEIPTVVVPRAPANFSAWGILTSDYREDAALTRVRAFDAGSIGGLVARPAHARGARDDRASRVRVRRGRARAPLSDRRCVTPGRSTRSPCRSRADGSTTSRRCSTGLRERFVALHRQLYGHGEPDAPLEVVTVRCRAVGARRASALSGVAGRRAGRAGRSRPVYFRGGTASSRHPVFDREQVARDQVIEGPAIVEEWTTTIVVPPGWRARADRLGDLVLRTEAGNDEHLHPASTSSPPRSSATGSPRPPLEMNKTLVRTAYNPLLYEVQDFGLGHRLAPRVCSGPRRPASRCSSARCRTRSRRASRSRGRRLRARATC